MGRTREIRAKSIKVSLYMVRRWLVKTGKVSRGLCERMDSGVRMRDATVRRRNDHRNKGSLYTWRGEGTYMM